MTSFQKKVMAALVGPGPHTTGRVAAAVEASTSGTGLALSKLKQQGLVKSQRVTGEDWWELATKTAEAVKPATPATMKSIEDVVAMVRTRCMVLVHDEDEKVGYASKAALDKAFRMVMAEQFGVVAEERPSTV